MMVSIPPPQDTAATNPSPSALGALAEVGQSVGQATFPITRDVLVRYAAASGDFNPIHYNDAAAKSSGLPGVIAHGMLTMGVAINLVTQWVGDPGAVLDYEVRFSRPIVVPWPEGTELTVSGQVTAYDACEGIATITLTVTCQEAKVLSKATARVLLKDELPGAGMPRTPHP
jgi:acyl dehydratase